MSEAKKPKNEKRVLPLRPSGESVNTQNTRPSQLLFGEVKRLEDLETQNQTLGYPKSDILGTQNLKSGNPNVDNLETQDIILGNPNVDSLETQDNISGYPNIDNLGTMVPKTNIWVPKKETNLGTKKPKSKNLGTQKTEQTEHYRKYELSRSTISIHIRADEPIVKKIKHFIVEHATEIPTMKEFFELSAMMFMANFGYPKTSDLGTNPPYDNRRLMIMFKTKPFIINLYLAYNSVFNEFSEANTKGKWSARWTPRDDEAAFRYNDINLQIVELGIIQTQINKGFGQNKIQTFKYYVDEIEKVLTSGVSDEMLETILKYHRQIWKNTTKREVDLSFLENNKEI